jgi:hypothetical protein
MIVRSCKNSAGGVLIVYKASKMIYEPSRSERQAAKGAKKIEQFNYVIQ